MLKRSNDRLSGVPFRCVALRCVALRRVHGRMNKTADIPIPKCATKNRDIEICELPRCPAAGRRERARAGPAERAGKDLPSMPRYGA